MKGARFWTFRPLDTWFFRDGSPYNAGEGSHGAGGVFPPFMFTVQGAVRVSLAEGQGWSGGDDRWPAELGTPERLGKVTLAGPYVVKDGEILYPAPLFLMYKPPVKRGKALLTRLKPGDEVVSDIGLRRFPVASPRMLEGKVAEDLWLDRATMQDLLDGSLPVESTMYLRDDLWQEEVHTGIARDAERHTAESGQLYVARHVRLKDGVALGVRVGGVPGGWHEKVAPVVPLGGEGRGAAVEVAEDDLPLPTPGRLTVLNGKVRFTVTLLTPGRYGDTRRVLLEGPPGVPGDAVSACVGKVVAAGGWDSRRREPLLLVPLVPAGSTWFFEADGEHVPEITELHGQNLGDPYGFGQILIGSWRD